MSALLFGHQSSYSDLLSAPPPGPERRSTTAATAYIEAHLAERLTPAAVAGAAGISLRTLEAAFRYDLRTTPTAFIRSRRLDRARADLLEAEGAQADRVTDVATRWGISHLGRFAAEYRARFGESPSQTLRRSRG
jgi:AraC-like DNA-binding protein